MFNETPCRERVLEWRRRGGSCAFLNWEVFVSDPAGVRHLPWSCLMRWPENVSLIYGGRGEADHPVSLFTGFLGGA